DRVECERTLAGTADAGEHGQPTDRQVEVQTLQVVRARPADLDGCGWPRHAFFLDGSARSGQVYDGCPGSPARRCTLAGQPGGLIWFYPSAAAVKTEFLKRSGGR